MTRLTKRKKRILEILSKDSENGISLLNELRFKYHQGLQTGPLSLQSTDQRRSFNRTVLENLDESAVYRMSSHTHFAESLTVGICARWIVWELIDQALLTALPERDELEVVVGQNEGTAYVKLKNEEYAAVGTSIPLTGIVLVANRELNDKDIELFSKVPWKIAGVTGAKVVSTPDTASVANLSNLPFYVEMPDGTWISSSRKRFKYR